MGKKSKRIAELEEIVEGLCQKVASLELAQSSRRIDFDNIKFGPSPIYPHHITSNITGMTDMLQDLQPDSKATCGYAGDGKDDLGVAL